MSTAVEIPYICRRCRGPARETRVQKRPAFYRIECQNVIECGDRSLPYNAAEHRRSVRAAERRQLKAARDARNLAIAQDGWAK